MSYGKILVVDDESHIVELVRFNLESNGYSVVEASDGKEALAKAKEESPDLILLDLMLPIIDGTEVCKKLKNDVSTESIPIIMLTAKSDEMDKIIGLEIGADDYITKPFSLRELLARIKAVLRRRTDIKIKEIDKVVRVEDLVIDEEKHEVLKNGEKLDLTLKEFELLNILAKNRGKVLSRNYLLDEIWGYDYFGETRTVDVHIRHLRKKIEDDDKNPKHIETIRGVGYKLR
ncbi:alkaline phosphatase synthesis transcriptional regulatory protein PhoP [Andreesenia angusta]|uniref:Alkaline phosphatase synthesis transcriptional regulatory protein PhoP n=1 Tax=Andreesenia angusta TaxID=39480 RepID=A0A1S1V8V1_9FIRM|nr:response regulator transcription factor [Andreesenia angusta]OHW63022.1 alkaline phosphatase synthesis transcriptional regulatory protein PhoP [Andreesenia angusta]